MPASTPRAHDSVCANERLDDVLVAVRADRVMMAGQRCRFRRPQSEQVFAPKPRRGEHSRKPAIVRDNIVQLLGDRPRVELFAREHVDGWNAWGDELEAA